MTTIAIEFPWGRYHGTPWGRNVNEGVVDWPPEPWRLVRALYATWRARAPELPEDVVVPLLDALADPPSYLVPPHRLAHTRHYFPDAKHGPKGGGTDKVLDTFAAMARGATLWIMWPGALESDQRAALATLCDRLTYLGRAESVCIARLAGDDEPTATSPDHTRVTAPRATLGAGEPGVADNPSGQGRAVLAVARPLSINALEVRPQQLRRSGHREPPGSRRVIYPEVAEAEVVRPGRRVVTRQATAVRMRVTGPALPSPRATLALTDALRNAALKTFGPAQTGRSSVQLFGKDRDGRHDDDHRHAHYLAFTSQGATRPSLDTLVVWAPGGLDGPAVEALSQVRKLWLPRGIGDFQPCRVAVEAIGDTADVAPELCGTDAPPTARRWHSLTPYIPPRHVRRQPTWDAHAEAYLRRDLAAAGYPSPVAMRPVTSADGAGPGNERRGRNRRPSEPWLAFRRHRTKENLRSARRATGFEIEFEEPAPGPLCLGALRHLGMGLFLPIANDNG